MQGLKIATTSKLNQESLYLPTFYLAPAVYRAKNIAWLDVEQREYRYRKGNENTSMKDCLPWEEISRKAKKCSNKCLPVTMQFMWKENVDLPRCQNIMDHRCMFEQIWQV